MAPEVDLSRQRPAENHHERLVAEQLDGIARTEGAASRASGRKVLISKV